MAVPMKEELRFAYSNADIFVIILTVIIMATVVDDPITNMSTTGVQSVVRDTLGIAVMPKWCAGSVDYLLTVSSNIL